MSTTTFSIPFSFTSVGKVATTDDYKAIWRTRVYAAIVSRPGERVMRPDFGSLLHTALFENVATAMEIATRTITIAFNTWLGALNLVDIVPKHDDYTGYLELTVNYTLPSGDTDSITINTAIFARSGDLIQEISRGQ